jgi:pyruvoyl-dependent arginine decarboxylase
VNIYITSGKAYGRTSLSAFDGALVDAGISYNLVTLSSFIPPKGKIILKKYVPSTDEFGNKLYVVKASIQSDKSGKFIGAALGWYQLSDGRGLFVEHEAISDTYRITGKKLKEDVRVSLVDLCKLRNYPIVEKKMKIKTSIIEVKNSHASAVVVAVYKSESWT